MVTLKVTKLFFDRKAVIDALGEASARNLSRAGAFIRTRARSSMRRRKKSSPPGQPPSAHVGTLKDLLYFAADLNTKSVVIGPEKFGEGKVPGLLEFGGDSTVIDHGKPRKAHYRGNPYMAPALRAEVDAGTIPPLWKDCIRSK